MERGAKKRLRTTTCSAFDAFNMVGERQVSSNLHKTEI